MSSMILIGDAGSSRTSWRVIGHDKKISQFESAGFNLAHDNIHSFLEQILSELRPYLSASSIFFYAAGITDEANQSPEIISAFQNHFKMANVLASSDLLGAARSLCLHEAGWVGILGTGSNICYYNGAKIERRIPALGYVLGDEGSGAFLGKKLLISFCRGNMDKGIRGKFMERYQLTEQKILESVYQNENPKKFLASFSTFIHENLSDPFCYQLVYDAFDSHLKIFFDHLSNRDSLHYTGSVAYHYADILRKVAVDRGITIGRITVSPIAGLTLFHQQN